MKYIRYFLFIILVIFALFPYKEVYFTLQKIFSNKHFYINTLEIKSYPFFLQLKDNTLIYNDIKLGNIKKVSFFISFFYNKGIFENIDLNFKSIKIGKLKIVYSLFNPISILIEGQSNKGKIKGKVDLIKKIAKIYILNLKDEDIKSLLKKDKLGFYYEIKF